MNNYILQDENAVFYECGYSCDNQVFVKFGKNSFFLTDSRYAIEARENIKNAEVIEITNPLIKEAKILLKKLGVKNIAFDPNDFTYAQFEEISKFSHINFIPKPNFSKKKRMVKSEFEIEILKQSAKLGSDCFNEFANFINKNGLDLSEEELFFNACQIFTKKGSLNLSFNPIVAINQNAAKAHALPGAEKLKKGDLLLLDAGVKFKRYCSDRTRTAFFDDKLEFEKNQKFKDSKQDEIYSIVKEAQNLAIKAVKPGILACEVDNTARKFIKNAGYEKEFFHSTGHGVGVDIHELPNINSKDNTILKEGMVFSIEPGIYINGEFGVRIEDVVVVTKEGCEIL